MDDADSGQDPATAQGAYLSFLHLRHLRLRDLQRTVSQSCKIVQICPPLWPSQSTFPAANNYRYQWIL